MVPPFLLIVGGGPRQHIFICSFIAALLSRTYYCFPPFAPRRSNCLGNNLISTNRWWNCRFVLAWLARYITGLDDVVLGAEDLRYAAKEIGRIGGVIDVEDVLDSIFRDFCIGK